MSDAVTGYLDVPGARLYHEVDGEGLPLTLVHAGVAHLRMWDEQVDAFSSAYRVVRYDTRGFGRTTSTDVAFSNRDDLRLLLDHLGIDRTHLVGLSRGATIALDFTLEHPDRVSALVFASSTPSGFDFEGPPEDQVYWEELERLEEAHDWDAVVDREVRYWTDGPGQSPERVAPTVREAMTRWGLENYRAEQPYGQPQPLEPPAVGRLGEVRVPTLVLWGDLDAASVLAGSPAVADGIAGARRRVVGGAAHMINLEQPAAFDQALLEFLRSAETPLSATS